MNDRTISRKNLDIKLLMAELEEDPSDPRSLYYLAQTYNCLENSEEAFKYFIKRIDHPTEGFIQEKVDALFEAGRLANFKLNKPWELCEKLYTEAYNLDNSRPESMYFIGIHYYMLGDFGRGAEGDLKLAFLYFKKAFEIGYPSHCQYSLKPTLSFYFLPKFLTPLCYTFGHYILGEQSALLFLTKNENARNTDEYSTILSWYKIFEKINSIKQTQWKSCISLDNTRVNKPFLCFVADGGFAKWTGSNILNEGMGGSETFVVEMARYIQKSNKYKVFVFCNCEKEEIFEDVQYMKLNDYFDFISKHDIKICVISRFSEYYPATLLCKVDSIFFIAHDLSLSGNVIPIDNKLKKIFCLTEWHVSYLQEIFPSLADKMEPIYYGVNKIFDIEEPPHSYYSKKSRPHMTPRIISSKSSIIKKPKNKIPYSFIYSSFPNRGLLELLQMWPSIHSHENTASLNIYSDIEGNWVKTNFPDLMHKIKNLLNSDEYKNLNIYYHGWVNKSVLASAWKKSEFWLYPCTFKETFCLTALEAAISKTLAITNNLASLQNTVGERGVSIPGDSTTVQWQKMTIEKIIEIFKNKNKYKNLIKENYNWATPLSWENQAFKFLNALENVK
jgi:tetratricopeptide (TPR) repeat protein